MASRRSFLPLGLSISVLCMSASGMPAASIEASASERIALLDCRMAGDYRWIELDRMGALLYVRAGSDHRIWSHGHSQLSNEEITSLFDLWAAADLPGHPSFYPFSEPEGLIVEHRFFSFLSSGPSVEVVTAHEYSMPPALDRLAKSLEVAAKVWHQGAPAGSLLVGVPEPLLVCLGDVEEETSLSRGSPQSKALLEASSELGRAVWVPEPETTGHWGSAHLIRPRSEAIRAPVLRLKGRDGVPGENPSER